jgi:zinc protease
MTMTELNEGRAAQPNDEPSAGPTPQAQQPRAARREQTSDPTVTNRSTHVARAGFAAHVVRTQLSMGATLLVLENHATPTLSLRASLRAGSYFEPRTRPGLARLTADMLARGTRRRTKLQLAGDLEAAGAELDFQTDPFAVNIAGRALAQDMALLLRTLAEELREPSFPADELEKLKQQTIAAIREQQANTRVRAYERFTQLVFDAANPFYLHAGERLIESISATTVADVRNFYEQCYGGRSLIIAIAGAVETEDVRAEFQRAFEAFAGPARVAVDVNDPAQQEAMQRDVVLLPEKANVDILLGSAAPLRRDAADYYAALLANSALGESTLSSRLGLQVRDREGLTYGIGSRFRAPSLAAGPWYIAVSVNPQNVEQAINSALGVLRAYVTDGISSDELAAEKSAAIGSFKVALATNAGLADALWNAEFYQLGPDYIDRYPQLIEAITDAEVNAAIRKYFRPEQLTIVIAGDYEAATAGAPTS